MAEAAAPRYIKAYQGSVGAQPASFGEGIATAAPFDAQPGMDVPAFTARNAATLPTQAPVEVAAYVPAQASRFALLYESRDRRLCLFEDAEGHLTSVDAKRLA